MSRIGKQLKLAMEDLNIEVAIDQANSLPPEDSIDGIINSVEENIENAQLNEEAAQNESEDLGNDTDSGLPNPDDESNGDSSEESSDTSTQNDESEESSETEDDSKNKEDKESEEDEDSEVDSPKADESADKVEDNSDKAEVAQEAINALEDIAQLLEQSSEIGGIDPNGAQVLDMSVNAITAPTGVAVESIDPSLFSGYSKRKHYTLEAASDIRETIKQITAKIINFIKNVLKYIKEAYRFYKSELFKEKQKLDTLKNIHRGRLKVDAVNKTIEAGFVSMLLDSKETDATGVFYSVEQTYEVMFKYMNVYKKDLSTAIANFDEFKKNTFDIDLKDESNELKRFTKDDLKQYGQFFGTHITEQLNSVKEIPGVSKPSSTISCFLSPLMCGGYQYGAFTANKINITSEDILQSSMFLKPIVDSETFGTEIETCELSLFNKYFGLMDKLFILNRRIGENIDYSEKEFNKLLDYLTAINGKLNQAINTNLTNAGVETNQANAPKILSHLIKTCVDDFYIKPVKDTLKYSTRLIKAINKYLELSTKEYQ